MARGNQDLDKMERISGNLAAKGCFAVVAGIIALIGYFFLYGGPGELKPPRCTLTVVAALTPSQESETITVEIRKSGGFRLLHNKNITSGTLELSKDRPRGKIELTLPGSGDVVYTVRSSSKFNFRGSPATGTCRETELPLHVKGDATYHLVRLLSPSPAPSGPTVSYTAALSADQPASNDPFQEAKLPVEVVVVAELGPIMVSEEIRIEFMRPNKSTVASTQLSLTEAQRTLETRVVFPEEGRYEFRMTGSGRVRMGAPQPAIRSFPLQAQGSVEVKAGGKLKYERIADLSKESYAANLLSP